MTKVPYIKRSEKKIVAPELIQEKATDKLNILVVDDDDDIGNILNVFLSKYGHNVKVVDNGSEAIELSMSEDFDLILTDLNMPNVTGRDVIKALNGLDKRPKIGLISGMSEGFNSVEGGENLNVDFIVKKPFNLSDISRNINDLIWGDS